MENLLSVLVEKGEVFVPHTLAAEFVRKAIDRGINPNGGLMIGAGQFFYI